MSGALEGRVALVTGAGSCIGRASAVAFAREGARVVLSDVVVEEGRETLSLIEEVCGDGLFIEGDVSISADARTIVQTAVEEYGRLDFAHNNVNIEGVQAPGKDGNEGSLDRVVVDLKGAWLSMKHEIPQMLDQGGGAIVNTASVAGAVGSPALDTHCACEGGVVLLTNAAAREYARQGIRVNAVCPGFITTPMIDDPRDPLGRKGLPEKIAEAVVWLCSDAAWFVTGHVMTMYGGEVARWPRAALAKAPS